MFSTLDEKVRAIGKVAELATALDKIVSLLESQKGPVILISGELHPGTYNNSGISKALNKFLNSKKYPATLCWGPVTFFAMNENINNELYEEAILPLVSSDNLTILHSFIRQRCHLWLIGDTIAYQRHHGYGVSQEGKTAYIAENVNIKEFIEQHLNNEIKNGNIKKIKSEKDLCYTFRRVDVVLDDDKRIKRCVSSPSKDEAIQYYVSMVKQIPEVCMIRCFEDDVYLDLSNYLCTEDLKRETLQKMINYEERTKNRFPELFFEFSKLNTEESNLERISSDKSVIFYRKLL